MKTRIFIIDDDPIFRMILQKMIYNIEPSAICHHFEDGETGLAGLEPLHNSPDNIIILLDINMPVLDGWGLLDRLENSNFYNIQHFNLYIVSSSTDESDKLKAGKYELVQNFYHKPLVKENIIEILN